MKRLTKLSVVILCFITFTLSPPIVSAQNNAIQLDGADDLVSLGNPDFDLVEGLTIMAWVKWNIDPSSGNRWANILTCNSTGSGDDGRFWLQHRNDNKRFEFALKTNKGRKYIFSKTIPAVDVWYYVVGTYDGSKMRLYVNGELERKAGHKGDIANFKSTFVTHIGSWTASSQNHRRFNGEIDKVSIWNTALSKDVLGAYACNPISVDETGLLAYYDFNEDSPNELIDLTGEGNDGTIFGGIKTANDNVICNVLPVTLVDFSAKYHSSAVHLVWNTASEINNDYFVIERSVNGVEFEAIGTIYGMGTTNMAQTYTYEDKEPLEGTVYYRLNQVDYNGEFEIHPIVSVVCAEEKEQYIHAYQSEQHSIFLQTFIPEGDYQLNIVDKMGKMIVNIKIPVQQRNQKFIFDLPQLTQGMYIIMMSNNNERFVKKIQMK